MYYIADCRNVAKIFYGLTGLLGCETFLETQEKHCKCGNEPRLRFVKEKTVWDVVDNIFN